MTEQRRINPSERRRTPRSTFIANAEFLDVKSGMRIHARTSDLSPQGCYVDTLNPFPEGTRLRLEITFLKDTIRVEVLVVHRKPNMGMGLVFTKIEPKEQEIVKSWLGALDRTEEQLRLKESGD